MQAAEQQASQQQQHEQQKQQQQQQAQQQQPQSQQQRCVGPWALEAAIGQGSFAVVWRARHVHTGAAAAVKEIALTKLNAKLRQSLESEVSILKRISHPNIVELHQVIEVRRVGGWWVGGWVGGVCDVRQEAVSCPALLAELVNCACNMCRI
jgi:serine/threonine-protein kinase ULK/ATG1